MPYDTMASMSKKNQAKKHKFKHVGHPQPQVSAVTQDAGPATSSAEVTQKSVAARPLARAYALSSQRDFSYVAVDLRKVVVLAVSLVASELILAFLFGYGGLGKTVYSLVQV